MKKTMERLLAWILSILLAFGTVAGALPTAAAAEGSWDGSLDFTWYDESNVQREYHIETPAQWAALAWICSEDLAYLQGNVAETTGGNVTSITGTIPTRQNTFAGVQFYLDSDLNMGGSYDPDTDEWSGPNYYPIGGQYRNDGYENAANGDIFYGLFSGSFNGQGHRVYNIYCSRGWGTSSNAQAGWYQSAGLFGRVGAETAADESGMDIVIENVAVDGYIESARSVGGIVGKTLRASAGHSVIIRNCLNYATVTDSDKKGVGGIVGSAWNGCYIINCANFGRIICGMQNGGGIAGSSEATCISCYNVGDVSESVVNHGQAYGTDNGGTTLINFYYAVDSVFDVGYPAIYSSRDQSQFEFYGMTSGDMQNQAFLARLNQYADEYGGWVILEDDESYGGYPVPEAFGDGGYVPPGPVEGTFTVTLAGEDTYTLTVAKDTGSASYRTGGVFFVKTGETVTLTVTGDEDQAVKDVSRLGGGDAVFTRTGGENTYSLSNVTEDMTIRVETAYGCTHTGTVVERQDPTCTEDGYEILECTKCGERYTRILGARGHSYTEVTTQPTLETLGRTEHTCAVCGDRYEDAFTLLVHYEGNGGSAPADEVVAVGSPATRPADPVHPEDKTFAGWYLDRDCTELYDFAQGLERSLTLYADWGATAWRITFSGGNAGALVNGRVVKETVVKEDNADLTFTVVPDGGYELVGVTANRIPPEGMWDGSETGGFAKGSGTASDPYLISSAAELAYLAAETNRTKNSSSGEYYRLTCDIDLKDLPWTPIGVKSDMPFQGNFDGGGHTITNLSVTGSGAGNEYLGLFGYVYGGISVPQFGRIYDLTVKGTVTGTSANGGAAGGIAGTLVGGGITGCVSYVTVSAPVAAGGIVGAAGRASSSVSAPELTDCVNHGPVTSAYLAGGIVGRADGVRISDCRNDAAVEAKNYYAGGIAGQLSVAACDGGSTTISRCGNSGPVTGTGANTSAGGLAGYVSTDTFLSYNNTAALRESYNTGDVTNSGVYTGGLVGQQPHVRTTLESCYNTGAVSATAESGTYYAGGAVGASLAALTMKNCYSAADVRIAAATGKRGGLAGKMTALTNVQNNYFYTSLATLRAPWPTLAGTTADNGKKVTKAELTALADTLGGSFTADDGTLNGGYPRLTWQRPAAEDTGSAALIDNGDGSYTLTGITGPVTVYITVQKRTYQVSFVTERGAQPPTQSVVYGELAVQPEIGADSYRLEGWCLDEERTELFDFSTPVTDNLTLYAKWAFQYYLVTFNSMGGSPVEGQTVNEEPWKAVRPAEDPVKEGYSFTGWYTDLLCRNLYDFDTVVQKDLKLYAGWKTGEFQLTVDPDNGEAPEKQTVRYGAQPVKPADPVKDGYVFDGWYTVAAGELSAPFSFASAKLTRDTLVRAKWVRACAVIVETDPQGAEVSLWLKGRRVEPGAGGVYLLGQDLAYYYEASAPGYRSATGLVWPLCATADKGEGEGPAETEENTEGESEAWVARIALTYIGDCTVSFGGDASVTVNGQAVTEPVEVPAGEGFTFRAQPPEGQEITNIDLSTAAEPETQGYVDLWDGVSADGDWQGSGTKADPYLIASAAQLAGLAWKVNDGKDSLSGVYFRLIVDVDLGGHDWKPIGGDLTVSRRDLLDAFSGHLDGGGHSISNLKVTSSQSYVGLFGYVDGGEIRDLRLVGAEVTGYAYVGGLVGCAAGGSTLDGCTVSGHVTGAHSHSGLAAGDYSRVGGLAGSLEGSAANCVNYAAVTGSYAVGGLVGSLEEESDSAIMNCGSEGTITGQGMTGGIAGLGERTAFENVWNTAAVTGGEETGGIAGRTTGGTMTAGANRGAVTGTTQVGGLVGLLRGTDVTGSYHTGTAAADGAGKTAAIVGGLAGTVAMSGSLTDCYTAGAVTAPAGGTAGALAGVLKLGAGVDNCAWLTGTAESAVGENGSAAAAEELLPLRRDQMLYGNLLPALNGAAERFTQDYCGENGGYPVTRAASALSAVRQGDGSLLVTVKEITGDTVITISVDKVSLNVGWRQCEDFTITPAEDTPLPRTAGENFRFTLTLSPGYEEREAGSLTVTANGETVTLTKTGTKTWTGELKNLTESQQLTVSGYEKGTYTVTFDANKGVLTGPAQQRVTYPGKAKAPAVPTRTDEVHAWQYTFLGWYTDQDAKEKYDFAKPVTADITLYAGWYFDNGMYMVYDLNLPNGASASGAYSGKTSLRIEEEQGAALTQKPETPACTFVNSQLGAQFLYWADEKGKQVDLDKYTVPKLSAAEMEEYRRKQILPETTLHAVWKVTSTPAQGEGTYEIPDAPTLEMLAGNVNAGLVATAGTTWVITGDIVLTTPVTVGTKENPFLGKLTGFNGDLGEFEDGQEPPHRSVTLAPGQTDGLVGYLGEGGTIQYIDVTGSVESDDTQPVGLVCNESMGAILHCNASGSVSGSGSLGGIVGQSGRNGTNGETTVRTRISGCVNRAEIISRGTAGQQGSAGGGESGATAHVRGVGGIAGLCVGTVEGCENYGEVTYASDVSGVVRPFFAGGICGSYYGSSLKNCKNEGDVESTSEGGGLVGALYAVDGICPVSKSTNSGDVLAAGSYGGGLVGYCREGSITFTDCANSGDVSHRFGQVSYEDGARMNIAYVGGFLGRVHGDASFTRCSNTGDVEANGDFVGGLVGRTGGVCTVLYAYSAGDVNAAGSGYVGGLVGRMAEGSFTNAYWYGEMLMGDARTGYISGDGAETVKNFYYADDVRFATGNAVTPPEGETVVGKPRSAFRSGEVSYLWQSGRVPQPGAG